MRTHVSLLIILAAGFEGRGSAQSWQSFRPETALVSELLVASTAYDGNQSPVLARLVDGRLLVAFHQGAPTNGYARAYQVSGSGFAPVSDVIGLNPNTPSAWKFGHIIVPLVDGGFGSLYGYSFGTRAQRFDGLLTPVGGEIVVPPQDSWPDATVLPSGEIQAMVGGPNTTSISLQRYDGILRPVGNPRTANITPTITAGYLAGISSSSSGNYTVTWAAAPANILLRTFSAADQAIGQEVQANTTTAGTRNYPSSVYNANGDLWVAWDGQGDGDLDGIFMRRFSASGVPLGPEIRVNQSVSGTQNLAHLAAGETGEVVVAWTGRDGSDLGVFARLYGANGTPITDEFRVNRYTNGLQRTGAFGGRKGVKMLRDRLVFSWVGEGQGGVGIFLTTFALSTVRNRFVPVAPCRIMETRADYNFEGRTGTFGPPFLGAGETRTLAVPSSNVCQIPSTAKAYSLNVTLIPRGTVDFATVWPAGDARPETWTVRSPDGQVVANATIAAAGTNGAVSVYASNQTDMIIDINGYFTEETTSGTNTVFYPMTPCRVIETRAEYRSPAGPFGPPRLDTGETRRFRFPSSPYCAVPAGATAYSATLTVVPPQPLAYMTLWPAGGSQPNVSSINSFAGRVLANHIIVPASADGSIDVFAFNRTDFIVDINGYFAPDDGQNGLYYFPQSPQRIFDSRGGNGSCGGPVFEDGTSRTISMTGCAGLPGSAKAYHITATSISGGAPMPFLTTWPTGQARPNASFSNAFEGQTVTNSTIVPAGTGGSIDMYAFRRTNVVVEVNGYFGR